MMKIIMVIRGIIDIRIIIVSMIITITMIIVIIIIIIIIIMIITMTYYTTYHRNVRLSFSISTTYQEIRFILRKR